MISPSEPAPPPPSPPDPAPPPAPEYVAAAIALMDSVIELYQSGNKRGTWDYNGREVRLSVVAMARVVTVVAEKG